jgi:ribonuclease HII
MYLSWYYEHGVDVEDSVGIDEVGRGPLAGPVVSAAVWISHDLAVAIEKNTSHLPVRDSKKMTRKQRAYFMIWLEDQDPSSIRYAIGSSSVDEIDNMNILNASLLSMSRAYDALAINVGIALVDGNVAPALSNNSANAVDIREDARTNVMAIIKGDDKVLSISIASIIAKEYRDSLMRKLAEEYPQYCWHTNVGYGSKAHLQAIYEFGATPHHRKSFAPISEIIKKRTEKEMLWD